MKYRYYIGRDNRKEQNKEHNTKKKGFRFLGSLDFIGATNRIRTIMGPLSRPRSKILRVAVSRIILSSEASKVKLVGNLVA